MANRLPRNPGEFLSYQSDAQYGDTPSFAVGASTALGEAMADVGQGLSARIGRMADKAVAREQTALGESVGRKAGEKFVQISTVEGKGKPAGATPSVTGASPAKAQNPGQDVPLQLRRDGTIAGEAFDAAAMKAYGWRMQQGLLTDLAQAYDANQDSPGGYEGAIGKIREQFLKEPILSEGPLREVFDQTFAEKITIGRLSVKSRHEARVQAEAAAAATDGLETLRQSIERDAYTIGGNPAGDEALSAQVNRAGRQIDALIADGTISASQGAKYRKAFENTVFAARTEGTFDALPNPEAQADFALGIMEDYAAGTGFAASLGLDDARKLSNDLYSRAVRNQNAVTSERKALTSQLETSMADDIAAIAATGEGLDPTQSGLTPDKVQTLLGDRALADWQAAQNTAQKGWQATAGMELETPAEISDRLEALKPDPAKPAFQNQLANYSAAASQAATILQERATDPLGQANRTGLIELATIDNANAEALATSLRTRRTQAETVARTYGVPPVVFRPDEIAHLKESVETQPDLLPRLASTMKAELGDLAMPALAQISDQAPELAWVTGIGIATGNSNVAIDLAATIKRRAEKSLKLKMPDPGTLNAVAYSMLGPALSELPDGAAAVLSTAGMLYENDAARIGFDATEVGTPGTPAANAYTKALNRALGSRQIDGQQWGGVTEVNGRRTIAPVDMPAASVEKLLHSIEDGDLPLLPAIAAGNGVEVRARDLRKAFLVATGDGRYRVALGEPNSFEPKFLESAGGGFWELDLRQLLSIRDATNAAGTARPQGLWTYGMGGR